MLVRDRRDSDVTRDDAAAARSAARGGTGAEFAICAIAVAGLCIGDFLLCWQRHWTVTHWLEPAVLVLAGFALACALPGRYERVATTAKWLLLWAIYSPAVLVLVYLATARGGPNYDVQLSAIDRALGFDWHTWLAFVVGYPILHKILAAAYVSFCIQIIFSAFYFAWFRHHSANAELMINGLLSLLLASLAFSLVPALGPCAGMARCNDWYLSDLNALRNGTMTVIDVAKLKGIIVFPSFHTVMALLFVYVYWRTRLLIPIVVLNFLMLMAIPSEGGHYVTDGIAGALIALASVCITRTVARNLRSP